MSKEKTIEEQISQITKQLEVIVMELKIRELESRAAVLLARAKLDRQKLDTFKDK